MYALTVVTAPASEPVSLTLAKAHLRIDHDAEDDLITGWIKAARELTESYTGKRWVTQTLRLTLAEWPTDCTSGIYGAIRLPVEPVSAVTLFKHYDAGGTEQTLVADTDYQTWLDHSPPLVCPAIDDTWPDLQSGKVAPIKIEFTAGVAADDVPEQVRTAILLCLGQWDQERAGGRSADLAPNSLPAGVKAQLDLLWNGAY